MLATTAVDLSLELYLKFIILRCNDRENNALKTYENIGEKRQNSFLKQNLISSPFPYETPSFL